MVKRAEEKQKVLQAPHVMTSTQPRHSTAHHIQQRTCMGLTVSLPEAQPDRKVKKGHNNEPSPPSSSEQRQLADADVALAAW